MIRSRLTVLLVATLAVLPLGIVWLAYVTNGATLSEVQREYAKDIFRSTSADVADLSAEYVDPIRSTAVRAADHLGAGIIRSDDPAATESYLRITVEREPRIASVAWYRDDGAIYEVARDGTRLVSSSFDPNVEEPAVTMTWRTLEGGVISQSTDTATLDVADPLLLVQSRLHGTAVSDLTDPNAPGQLLTFAATADGPIPDPGTVFVTMDLTDLGRFVGDYAPTAASRVFIVSGGELVAHSRPELIDRPPAGTAVATLPDLPTTAAATLAVGGDGWQLLSLNDEAYHAVSRTVDVEGLDWTVLSIGPEDDFSQQFVDERKTDTSTLLAIAGLAILLAIPLARLAVRDVGSLRIAAHRDSLTGLVNRRTFEKHGAVLIAAARRRRRSVGALMVDIDHFKQLNDTYGHHAGDEVLEAVAGRISHSVAKTDLVARLGGDEIALLLEGADLAASQSVAARLRNAVTATPISTNRGPIYVTVSIGASATGGAERARLEDVLKAADRALYASKRAGRDRITAVQIARTH